MASIKWLDDVGYAELTNLKPSPGDRFFDWTPDAEPIGPAEVGLGTGKIEAFTFREDYLVSFEIRGIPTSELSKMLRLQTHLMDGYIVAVECDHPMHEIFALSALAPGTTPSIDFTDSQCLEYTFGVRLLAVDEDTIVTDGDEEEPRYPPIPPGGAESDCLNPDTTTTAATSGLSGLQVRGDDLSAWELDEYDEFLADTATNANYEDGTPYNPVNNPAPAAFLEWNYDWNTNAPGVNRNRISQLSVNGGHRTVKGIKTDADDTFHQFGFELVANGRLGGTPLNAVALRLRCKFSSNFAVYDPTDPNGRGILLIDCDQFQSSPSRTFNAGLYNKGTYPLTDIGDGGDLLIAHMSYLISGSGDEHTAELGLMSELVFTGTPREFVMYAGQTLDEFGDVIAGEFRMAIWTGPAFGTLTKVYDHTMTGLSSPVNFGDIAMLRATDPWLLLTGTEMCYELIEWEVVDMEDHYDPFDLGEPALTPRVLTSIAITPDPFSVAEGDTQAMTAQGLDQVGDPIATGTLTWDSSDDATATVDGSGVVTGVADGSCTITATSGAIVSNAAACTVEATMYATWNPADKSAGMTLSGGNLTTDGGDSGTVRATIGKSSGKWYWEITVGTPPERDIGIALATHDLSVFCGGTGESWAYYGGDGEVYHDDPGTAHGVTFGSGDVVGVALDMDSGKVWWRVNGTWQSGDPATGTTPAFSGLTGTMYPCIGGGDNGIATANFGASAFANTPPSGFVGLS